MASYPHSSSAGDPRIGAAQASKARQRFQLQRGRAVVQLLQPLPDWAWVSASLLGFMCLSSQYPMLSICSIATLALVASMLLFRGEPPILFACCGMHWLQGTAATIYCDLFSVSMTDAFGPTSMETAAWLSLGAVLALAIGMRTALSPFRRGTVLSDKVEMDALSFEFGRLFRLWIVCYVLGYAANKIGWRVPAVQQFLVPVSALKWAVFFMMVRSVFAKDENQTTLYAVILIEFVGGLVGYFSSFKEVLFMFMIAALSGRRALNPRLKAAFWTAAIVATVASVFWSSIKVEYRQIMTRSDSLGSTRSPATMGEKISFLKEQLASYDGAKIEDGVKRLISRVAYTQLFAQTISHTPAFEPFAKGELWYGAVKHILMPRIIFRNKEVTDDSARTRRFTGQRVSGADDGTSIGIGYISESYADFGRIGMFVPLYLVGLLLGAIYDRSLKNQHSLLVGSAVGTTIVYSMLQGFGMANMKVLGGLLVHALAFWTINKVYGRQVISWLRGG